MAKIYTPHIYEGTAGACRYDSEKKQIVVSLEDRIQLLVDMINAPIRHMVQRYDPKLDTPNHPMPPEKKILDAINGSLEGEEVAVLLTKPSTPILGTADYIVSAVYCILSPKEYKKVSESIMEEELESLSVKLKLKEEK